MSVYSTALEGIRVAQEKLERAAQTIAQHSSMILPKRPDTSDSVQISLEGYRSRADHPDGTLDYAEEIILLLEAKTAVKANLRVVTSQSELDKDLLDILT